MGVSNIHFLCGGHHRWEQTTSCQPLMQCARQGKNSRCGSCAASAAEKRHLLFHRAGLQTAAAAAGLTAKACRAGPAAPSRSSTTLAGSSCSSYSPSSAMRALYAASSLTAAVRGHQGGQQGGQQPDRRGQGGWSEKLLRSPAANHAVACQCLAVLAPELDKTD